MPHRILHNLTRFSLHISLFLLLLTGLCGGASASDLFYPTGTYTTSAVDLKVAARSIPMAWERSYRSNRVVKEPGVMFFEFLLPVDRPLGAAEGTLVNYVNYYN